ncbi:single-stranded DNA-binding protein [uncultured Microbacterium sp.]|uniref:single-stranded DNA-binding protein n=1 Tax=uncultured Microbacterium sp. TaxID=191216 RepID=UPI0025E453A5|nr:single-stranded DNA-binding protein [uncultured Microbacterium sp.]
MTGETTLTIVGNLTADPELRHTQNGLAVVNFTVASTPRVFDRQANEWKDGAALFLRCSAWREFAEHIAGSLTKGTRVIVTGRLVQKSYQDREGNNRSSLELEVDEIGPSLRYATAQVARTARGNGSSGRPSSAPYGASGDQPVEESGAWSTGGGSYGDDTPF